MTSIFNIAGYAIYPKIRKAIENAGYSAQSLSSGLKANSSVGEFAIGATLSSKANSLKAAVSNAGQAKNLLDTAKGGLEEILDLLEQQQTLATKATDTSLSSSQLAALNIEFQELKTEIDRIANNTTFNTKNLIDGSISGTSKITSQTGQSDENYTLLNLTDFSLSGTVASGELVTASTFSAIASDTVGDSYASTTITLTHVDGSTPLASNATFEVGGASVSFGSGDTTSAQLATSLVAALEASTDNNIRQFTYLDNGDGTITVTGADLGDLYNAVTFELTGDGTGGVSAATLGTSTDIDGVTSTISAAAGSTEGADRTVDSADLTYDDALQGSLTGFTASLSTSGTQNTVTFTVEVNDVTYTSQAVTLFGTGGFNSKGDTIRNGQVLTFYNTGGPTDDSGEFTDNAFTLTVGATDITISGGTQSTFEDDLTATALGFTTQLSANKINQDRDIVLAVVDANGGDFDISSAESSVLEGIQGYDSIGTNAKGDVSLISDSYGSDGSHSAIGPFSFDSLTHILTTTIGGETYSADLSGSGFDGTYTTADHNLTTDGIITFTSAATDDGRQLQIDLSNVTDDEISLNTTATSKTFTDALDTLFGVSSNTSLTFQVGSETTDTIGFALEGANTSDIYLNDSGVAKTLSVETTANATLAADVLTNAINEINERIATVSGASVAFSSSIDSNNIAIQNAEASSSLLLGTDFAEESTKFVEFSLQAEAGVAALAQLNAKLSRVLKLLE